MLKQIALGIVLLAGLLAGTAWADEALNEALMDATRRCDTAGVAAFISKGADVDAFLNTNTYGGQTPLYTAVSLHRSNPKFYQIYGDYRPIIKLLILKGANVNAKDAQGFTTLQKAQTKEIAELLITNGADVNAKDEYGGTALMSAAYYRDRKDLAEFLISRGADVNSKDKYAETPLFVAAKQGNKAVVELLLSKGADVYAKNSTGKTALDIATKERKNEVVALLQALFQKQEEIAQIEGALQKNASNQLKTFNLVVASYKDRIMSDDIRRPFIALAAKLKPAPDVPEGARKYLIRGNALMGDAKNPGEARAAIQEYQSLAGRAVVG